MNRVVKEHYPVAALPEDLRATIPAATHVTVTIEEERPRKSLEELLSEMADYRSRHAGEEISEAEAVARVRALRDEWED